MILLLEISSYSNLLVIPVAGLLAGLASETEQLFFVFRKVCQTLNQAQTFLLVSAIISNKLSNFCLDFSCDRP